MCGQSLLHLQLMLFTATCMMTAPRVFKLDFGGQWPDVLPPVGMSESWQENLQDQSMRYKLRSRKRVCALVS